MASGVYKVIIRRTCTIESLKTKRRIYAFCAVSEWRWALWASFATVLAFVLWVELISCTIWAIISRLCSITWTFLIGCFGKVLGAVYTRAEGLTSITSLDTAACALITIIEQTCSTDVAVFRWWVESTSKASASLFGSTINKLIRVTLKTWTIFWTWFAPRTTGYTFFSFGISTRWTYGCSSYIFWVVILTVYF